MNTLSLHSPNSLRLLCVLIYTFLVKEIRWVVLGFLAAACWATRFEAETGEPDIENRREPSIDFVRDAELVGGPRFSGRTGNPQVYPEGVNPPPAIHSRSFSFHACLVSGIFCGLVFCALLAWFSTIRA